MKKKDKQNKPKVMPEFAFKEFTPEEDRIYEEAVNKYRQAIAAGKTLKEAYDSYEIADKDLERLIQADFLKILIAERHFGGRQSLDVVAKELGVPSKLVKETHARMLQEVGVTAAESFISEFGGIAPKTDD
mgnify:CR=1 FL=1